MEMVHYIFFLTNGKPVFQDNKVCLQNVKDGTIHLVEINMEIKNLIRKNFPDVELPALNNDVSPCASVDEVKITEPEPGCSNEGLNNKTERYWTRDATLCLINLRKIFDSSFKSTTIKNDRVWDMLVNEMKKKNFDFTASQCKDKWQYLKRRYMKKSDNMGPRGTGEERIKFDFFEEMDEMLRDKHNVKPVALGSSIKGNTLPSSSDEGDPVDESDGEPAKKKIKKKKLMIRKKEDIVSQFINDFKTHITEKEARKERRHKEVLECRKRATDVFAEKMDALINKLK